MRMLTSQTLAEVMTRCAGRSFYKACVAFDNKNAMIEFIKELRANGDIPNVRQVIVNNTDDYLKLEFYNDSMLEVILGTESNLRGRKYHWFIASGTFCRELLEQMENMVVPYRITGDEFVSRFMEETKETYEELDAFLDSFVVNKSE